jgi:Bacteriophage related domain of unknown function
MTPKMISAAEAHALAVIGAQYPDIPVIMSGQAVPAKKHVYIRFWVIPSEEVIPTGLGIGAKSRNVGIVQADVYGPKDKGSGETGDIAHFIGKQFKRLPVEVPNEGWIVFKDAGVRDMGSAGEEYRQCVRVPYRYDFSED